TPGIPGAVDSVIESFEIRLARAEAQAARAFESIAQILESDTAARDGDRRAPIDAVRRLESIRANLTTDGTRGDRFPEPIARDPKPPSDLKAAVSQIAMRRHKLEARAAAREPGPPDANPEAGAGSDAAPGALDAAQPLAQLLLDDVRALALKLDEMR